MHQRVLLHLRRDDESYELELATRAVAPAKQHVAFRLAVAPRAEQLETIKWRHRCMALA